MVKEVCSERPSTYRFFDRVANQKTKMWFHYSDAQGRLKNNFGRSPIGWHWLSERKELCHLRETSIASGASVPKTGADVESPKLFLPHPLACLTGN